MSAVNPPADPLALLLRRTRELYQAGQAPAALALLEALPALQNPQPAHAELLNMAGACALAMGQAARAEALLRQAMALRPDYLDPPNNLGVLLQQQGRLAEAEAACRRATAINPRFAGAWLNLALSLTGQHKLAEAEAACRQLLALAPQHADAHHLLGVVLRGGGRFAESEAACREALRLAPGHPLIANNLALALLGQRRLPEAEAAWRQALAFKPDFAEALHALADLLRDQRRQAEAEPLYRRLLELNPAAEGAHAALANILVNRGALEEAEPLCRRASELKPDDGFALSLWIMVRRNLCLWEGLDEAEQKLGVLLAASAGGGIQPNRLIALAGFSALQQREASRQLGEQILGTLPSRAPLCTRRPQPKQKLRIGYLSADFHAHATVFLLAGVLERHDHAAFELFLYSYGPDIDSPERRRMRAAADHFCELQTLGDEDAAARIAADDIDILVDLKGYTNRVRPRISAQRPAPLTINWLGYPGTLGVPAMADYFIGDAIASPLHHAPHFSETLALLPRCYQPNDATRPVGRTPARAEVGLPPDAFVFCNFNQAYKTTPQRWAQWCGLLQAVPGSVLWLLAAPEAGTNQRLREAAARHGIDPARLVFAPTADQTTHLGRLPLADLALDTFPCASHTTASDALWTGLPLLTQLGETFASRVAGSILHSMNLPELITENDNDYVARALELARNPERLRALRERIAQGRKTAPLFDTEGFTRDLEKLYWRIWEQECEGRREAIGA